MEAPAYRNLNRWTNRISFWPLICGLFIAQGIASELRADIPWPEVTRRVAFENERLSRRPQGHAGEYFIVCTLYYTPMESGFTAERGFNAAPTVRPGLRGRKYPHDFLVAVKKEGFGRLREPVNGCNYIRFNGGSSYSFAKQVVGRGTDSLVPRFSAATRRGQRGLGYGVAIEMADL